MIKELKIELLKEITKITNVKASLSEIKQDVKYPCFFCEYITSETKSIATIDYMNIIDFDIIYLPNNIKEIEDIVNQLNKIKSINFNSKKVLVENTNIDIVDSILHYQVKLYSRYENLKEIEPTLNSVKLLKSELEKITSKKVFYLNANLENVADGFFVIEPSKTETINTNVLGCKDYEREINLRYITSDLTVDLYGYLEDTLDKLLNELKGKNGIYRINYSLDLSYEKEEYEELNIINHRLFIQLTERKK